MGLGDLNPVRIVEGKGAIGESGLGSLVIGAGLAAMGIPPGMAALYTGGATAALTGSLQKGLFAGMGAYGGAGLMSGLEGLGAEELAKDEAAKTALSGTDLAADQAYSANQARTASALQEAATNPASTVESVKAAQTAAAPYQATPINAAQTGQTVQTTTQAPGLFERAGQNFSNAGAGLERLTSSGGIDALRAQMAAAGGPSLNMAAGTAAAGALGSSSANQRNPAADAKPLSPGYIRQFSYDPFSQRYTALTPVAADKWGARTFQDAYKAADGGIVALAHGGDVRHFDEGGYTSYSTQEINDYINSHPGVDVGAATKEFNADPAAVAAARDAQNTVQNVYENVLGRNADPSGLAYWTNQITSGTATPEQLYQNFLTSAQANNELGNFGMSLEQATSPYKGYTSSNERSIVDEWAQNVLGRGLTAEDKQQQWYLQAMDRNAMNTYDAAQNIYGNFQKYASDVGAKSVAEKAALARQTIAAKGLTDADVYAQTGKTIEQLIGAPKTDLDIFHASQLLAPTNSAFDFASLKPKTAMPSTSPSTYAPTGTTNPYGNAVNPGDITRNADGSTTVTPNIPGRPYGGFTGMDQVRNAYTQGGGSLGYTSPVVTSAAQHKAMYDRQTGGSRAAYDYLMGGAPNPITPYTATGEVYKPYGESVLGIPADPTARALIWDEKTRRYVPNPQYVKPMTLEEKAAAAEASKAAAAAKAASAATIAAADGGLMGMASGGLGSLGGYSDGGRLLKGPGDGVSDSIPASIGDKQPARLADGEFVVPARIVSELGNGSTDAGARKLYAMMDRVQKARGKTTGKGKVATNSRADKYLPV